MKNLKRILILLAAFFLVPLSHAADSKSKPNVLLIISDDLNDWIGPMHGHPQTKTPNLDKLASRGVTFMNAQASAPFCNPSRASFMTGRRPSTTGIYDNDQPAMPHIPRGVALNDYLRKFGYTSLGAGKIYHYRQYRPEDWDKVVFFSDDTLPMHPAKRRPDPFGYRMFTEDKPTNPFDEQRAESELVDARTVSWCIEQLKERDDQTNSFFLVCGIHRPHTPWDVPKKYFDMHPLEEIELPPVTNNDLGDVPPAGIAFARTNVHERVLKAGIWKDRVRAYLAAISYMDAQAGRMLDALNKSKFRDNTVVVFVGDHGWHLGEKQHWAKCDLWREGTRTPMIWAVPGVTKPGSVCERAVDLTSIFPTICELTETPIPKWAEGPSLKPLLANPTAKWKQPAISTFLRNNHAISTDEWRYIRYADGTEELYNEKSDPNEWRNLANKPEFAKVKNGLAKFLPKINAEPVPRRANSDGERERKPGKRARRNAAERGK